MFTSSIRLRLRNINVMAMHGRQRNVLKIDLHVENCCFDHRTYFFFEVLVALAVFVAYLSITGAGETESPCRVLKQTNFKFPLV